MLTFRYMNTSDLETVTKIYEKCFFEECHGKCNNVTYRDNILLAVLDERVVGMATIDYLVDNFLSKKTAYINNVCVDPSYSNMGIGYKLMLECEKICKESNCSYIKLTSSQKRIFAHKLYHKLGFKIYDTTVFKKNI